VIFSSRIIPGNERPVFDMLGDLLRRGVHLHTRVTDPSVHTSGHAGRTEQQRMIELLRPRRFIPLHGTLHHMRRHADLALELGVPSLVTENGIPVCIGPDAFHVDEPVPCGRIAVSAEGTELSSELLKRRSELGRTGAVFVSVVVDVEGRLLGAPEVTARGVAGVDDNTDALRFVGRQVAWLFESSRTNGDVADEIRRAVRRAVAELSGYRPVVDVQIHRI
jgi:ribonuclease J